MGVLDTNAFDDSAPAGRVAPNQGVAMIVAGALVFLVLARRGFASALAR